MSKIKQIFFVLVFLLFSIYFGSYIKGQSISSTNDVISFFKNINTNLTQKVRTHFNKSSQIKTLLLENEELKKKAVLLNTYAYELNQILKDTNSTKFTPNIKLIRTLSYAKIGDYNKFWVDFKNNNKNKIYGAIFNAHTAGIITSKDSNFMLILQNDELASFSAYIGDEKIPAIVNGDGTRVIAKFIPRWLNPKIGDEVYTSGLDEVFFAGVPVGVIDEIIDEDLYKSAVIKPYFDEVTPAFLYVVTKER